MTIETQQLVQKCIAGQQPAVVELIDRYKSMVFGLCYRMMRDYGEAEDVMQETFVRVIGNLHRWDSTRRFEPWLMTIAGNRCRTHLAKRKRRVNACSLDYSVPDDSTELASAKLLEEELRLVLEKVRDEYREAFLMFHQREMSYIEIGKELNVPLGTVKTWVHRARQDVVRHLRERGVINHSKN